MSDVHVRSQAEELEDEVPPPRPGAQPILEWEVRLSNRYVALCQTPHTRSQAKPTGSGPVLSTHCVRSADCAMIENVCWRDPAPRGWVSLELPRTCTRYPPHVSG